MSHVVRRLVVRGLVQRVGYRAFVEHVAWKLDVEGWVRNRVDGSVETVVAGPAAAVEGMIEACRRGPTSARVDALEEHAAGADDVALRHHGERFSVLPTV